MGISANRTKIQKPNYFNAAIPVISSYILYSFAFYDKSPNLTSVTIDYPNETEAARVDC